MKIESINIKIEELMSKLSHLKSLELEEDTYAFFFSRSGMLDKRVMIRINASAWITNHSCKVNVQTREILRSHNGNYLLFYCSVYIYIYIYIYVCMYVCMYYQHKLQIRK